MSEDLNIIKQLTEDELRRLDRLQLYGNIKLHYSDRIYDIYYDRLYSLGLLSKHRVHEDSIIVSIITLGQSVARTYRKLSMLIE